MSPSTFFARPKSAINGVSSLVKEHVGRFQVAVDNAMLVHIVDASRQRARPARAASSGGNGVPLIFLAEITSFDEFACCSMAVPDAHPLHAACTRLGWSSWRRRFRLGEEAAYVGLVGELRRRGSS